MKKKLLSTAVLTAMLSPVSFQHYALAESEATGGSGPTVYGQVRLGIQRNEIPVDGNNWGLEIVHHVLALKVKNKLVQIQQPFTNMNSV